MGVIADLMVKVGADTAAFKTGMSQVATDVEDAGSGLGKFGTLAAGAGLLAAGAVTGIVAFGEHAVEHATEAGQAAYDMSEKFGLLPGVASQWMSVGNQMGVSSDIIGKGFQLLSKNVEQMNLQMKATPSVADATAVASGRAQIAQDRYNAAVKQYGPNSQQAQAAFVSMKSAQDAASVAQEKAIKALGPAAQAFSELGLNVFDASGKVKDSNELMLETADVFAKMPDGPEKAGLAMKLFGKSGTDMIPVLNQGRAGIEAMIASGKTMGDIMSGPQVEAAHKLYLEQQKLNEAESGATTQIGLFLMPIMTNFMNLILGRVVPAIQTFGAYFEDHIMPALTQVWALIMSALQPALKVLTENWNTISTVLKVVGIVIGAVILVALAAIVVAVILVINIIALLVKGIEWFVTQTKMQLSEAGAMFSALGTAASSAKNWIIDEWNKLVGFVTGLPGRISSAASGMWNGIQQAFRSAVNWIIGHWDSLHFTIGGGTFAGQTIPSVTLGVPQIPYFHTGIDFVPQDTLAYLQKGERVVSAENNRARPYVTTSSSSSAPEIHNHFHLEGALIMEGPLLDALANKLAQRGFYAIGT